MRLRNLPFTFALTASVASAQLLDSNGYADFNAVTSAFYVGQGSNASGSETVSSDGASVTLDGNQWRVYPISSGYTVTSDTLLVVTVDSSDVGEVIGVSLDIDNTAVNNQCLFFFGGSQMTSSFTSYNWPISPEYTVGTGSYTYTIPVGTYFTGTVNYLGLFADDDSAPMSANVTFSNIRLHEPSSGGGDPGDPGGDTSADDLYVEGIARVDGGLHLVSEGVYIYPDTATYDADGEPSLSIDSTGSVTTNSQIGATHSSFLETEEDRIIYFRWVDTLDVQIDDPNNSGGAVLDNQVNYIEFDDVRVWGSITVTVTGNWFYGLNVGKIQKSFAIGRNEGWINTNYGEWLDYAQGPIVERFKIGSATSESGKLRIPIYAVENSKNEISVYVEGHISVGNPTYSFDPYETISMTGWEIDTKNELAEETIQLDGPLLIGDYEHSLETSATAGTIYFDASASDFKGYDGTAWKSFTSEGSGPADSATQLIQPGTSDQKLYVDPSTGVVLLSAAQGDISMGSFGTN
ncbi:MAG: hypothetical protein AAF546_01705 [Verrucomicrobiota bacterium]